MNHWHGQTNASHPGGPETPPQKWRIPRGASGAREGLWGRDHSEPTWPFPISQVHHWRQIKFKASHGTQQIAVRRLSCYWSILSRFFSFFFFFYFFFNFFFFLQRSKRGVGKEGRLVKRKWCRQMTGTGLWGGSVYAAVRRYSWKLPEYQFPLVYECAGQYVYHL